ncbi:hypothetical protein GGR26_001361 [Lewinella marina]|uniref:Uncharacterized protein n=1 Tax=Neolewinella marina TaxID=438751 RepID=A0A2G0CFF1_9BACT|nr:hypothetical protein [Neolewinella marina]NJB85616.1 hypothetical protein [Neolewinella marina]PHK98699.1 hypothetical protein CGL56_09540 [Neolewinella marina]
MNYLTLKNDRKRRRQARTVTFVVTTLMLGAAAYGMGATQELAELFQQWMGTQPVSEPVASLI